VLGTAREAGLQADAAGTGRLVLTHLWPGTDPESSLAAARAGYAGPIDVARGGLTVAI